MRRSLSVGLLALTIGLATTLLWGGDATAGQYKDLQNAVPNAGCISSHSSPKNVSTAMGGELFAFITPSTDNYRCCIASNATGQDLIVRLYGLTGSVLATFETAVNGGGCTPFVNLKFGFEFMCGVWSGSGSAVSATAHYVLNVCRN